MTIPLREHLRLSGIEVKRVVLRKQFLLAIAVVLWLVYYNLFTWPPKGTPTGLFGICAAGTPDGVLYSFMAATAGTATLAVDTESGFLGLTLSRNVHRAHHILHKIVAVFTVILGMFLLRYSLMYIVGAFVYPWALPQLGDCVQYYTEPGGAIHCVATTPNTLKLAFGPFPALFLTHPVLNDFIGGIMVAAGTNVMALCGILASASGANVFVSMSVPVVLAFGIRLTVEDLIPGWADPTGLVYVHGHIHGLEYAGIPWFWTWLISFFAWTIGLTLLSMYIAEKRELGAKESTS